MTDNLNLTPKQRDAILRQFYRRLRYHKGYDEYQKVLYEILNENTMEEEKSCPEPEAQHPNLREWRRMVSKILDLATPRDK